mgnify:CR=1 FL=1
MKAKFLICFLLLIVNIHAENVSVKCYDSRFNDVQSIQIIEAQKNGIVPMKSFQKNDELVRLDYNLWYKVGSLDNSHPFVLSYVKEFLIDLSKEFKNLSGCYVSNFVITSALRTHDDIAKLRQLNINAVNNSCHLYGTTIDISKFYFNTVVYYKSEYLHNCLSTILYEMQKKGRCYVKNEKNCYHITIIKID